MTWAQRMFGGLRGSSRSRRASGSVGPFLAGAGTGGILSGLNSLFGSNGSGGVLPLIGIGVAVLAIAVILGGRGNTRRNPVWLAAVIPSLITAAAIGASAWITYEQNERHHREYAGGRDGDKGNLHPAAITGIIIAAGALGAWLLLRK